MAFRTRICETGSLLWKVHIMVRKQCHLSSPFHLFLLKILNLPIDLLKANWAKSLDSVKHHSFTDVHGAPRDTNQAPGLLTALYPVSNHIISPPKWANHKQEDLHRAALLTAVLCLFISMNHRLLTGCAEEAGPVNSVVVAQIAVVCYVDVASTDLLQGLKLQRGNTLLL